MADKLYKGIILLSRISHIGISSSVAKLNLSKALVSSYPLPKFYSGVNMDRPKA